MSNPLDVAIDAVGSAWVTSPSSNTLTEFSSTGVATKSFTATNPNYVLIDTAGNGASSVGAGDVFTNGVYSFTSGSGDKVKCNDADATGAGDCIYEITSSGTEDTPTYLTGAYKLVGSNELVNDGNYNYFADTGNSRFVEATPASPGAGVSDDTKAYTANSAAFEYIAIASPDGGYLWATDPTNGIICRVVTDTNANCDTANVPSPEKIAIDATGNAWTPSSATNTLYRVLTTKAGSIPLSPAGGYTGGGLNTPFGVGIDGNGTVWETNTGSIAFGTGATTCTGCSISAFLGSNGKAVTPGSVGTSGSSYYNPNGGYVSGNTSGNVGYGNLAIDGSGDMWIVNSGENSVTEIIGVATPTVTPLAYAVANGELGTTP
jgi:hypothetical protein